MLYGLREGEDGRSEFERTLHCSHPKLTHFLSFYHLQIKDGKIVKDVLKANLLKEAGANDKIVNELVADCHALTNAQKCELASQLIDCLSKSNAKHGKSPK